MAALSCPRVEVHYYSIITYIRSILNNLFTPARATTVSSIIRFNGMFIVYCLERSHPIPSMHQDRGTMRTMTIGVIDK